MYFGLTNVECTVHKAASAKSLLHKKESDPAYRNGREGLLRAGTFLGEVREAHFPEEGHPPGAGPSARPSRMPTYSLSPAVICVAERAPSAVVAAAASGQTQSVKAG